MRFITEKRLSQAQLGRTRTLASINEKEPKTNKNGKNVK